MLSRRQAVFLPFAAMALHATGARAQAQVPIADMHSLWRLRRNRSEVAVRVPPALWSNDGEVVKQWALMGQGIMLRSEWDVADDLRAGRLVRVLPEWKLPDADVVALVDQRAGLPARVRLFLAFLQERFKPAPPWRAAGQPAQG